MAHIHTTQNWFSLLIQIIDLDGGKIQTETINFANTEVLKIKLWPVNSKLFRNCDFHTGMVHKMSPGPIEKATRKVI